MDRDKWEEVEEHCAIGVIGALFCFVLIILYSLYLEYDSPFIPSASGLAG
jgi:hypothetical protein